MSVRTIVIGVLALVFGLSAALGVNLFYKQSQGPAAADTVSVVVSRSDVPRGVVLTDAQLATRDVPADLVPAGAITERESAVGRVAFHSLVKDEPILERKLSPKNAKGGLASLVPRGMRAFTIQTPQLAAQVAGFILPGNKVDVLLTVSGVGSQELTGGAVTTTLLQNVEILAVDQRLDAPYENKVDTKSLQSVTLLVTPDQAAKLDLGQNRGTLHLSLRNPEDANAARAQPATLSGLQFHQEKPWGEQAKMLIEALAKLGEKKPAADGKGNKTAKAADDDDAPPPPLEIRTLRGNQYGVVRLEPVVHRGGRR